MDFLEQLWKRMLMKHLTNFTAETIDTVAPYKTFIPKKASLKNEPWLTNSLFKCSIQYLWCLRWFFLHFRRARITIIFKEIPTICLTSNINYWICTIVHGHPLIQSFNNRPLIQNHLCALIWSFDKNKKSACRRNKYVHY